MTELAIASGNDIYLIDIELPDERRVLRGHEHKVVTVAFSGELLASGSYDSMVRLWDLTTNESRVLEGHTGPVSSVAFSVNGSFLASGSEDCTIRLWDPLTGECIRLLEGHTFLIFSVAFSVDD
jgi:WD40 repeat protein